MTALTLQVKRGSVESDAVVRIEVACNDVGQALARLDEAYAEARAKLGGTLNPIPGRGCQQHSHEEWIG